MKTLSDKHIEHLKRLDEEKQQKKKQYFLDKIKLMLEKYNCTSMKDLNDESAILFIQEMINEPEVTVLNEDADIEPDLDDNITDKEYLEHVIMSSADPEKVAKAQEMLNKLDDDNAESMQNGSPFIISKNGEEYEVIQKSFDKETGIYTGEDFKGELIEYTADDVVQ